MKCRPTTSHQDAKLVKYNALDILRENVMKSRPTTNKTFVSENLNENSDLNDPKWSEIKKLGNDEDRRTYAMRAFRNKVPGDPSVNR